MRIRVTGVTGYIGGRLVPQLLAAGHEVRVLVRDRRRILGRPWEGQVDIREGDLLEPATVAGLGDGVEAAYYLIHSMEGGTNYHERDMQAAAHFCDALPEVKLVVYLGGLLPNAAKVSRHLWSRSEVGRLLRERLPTTEFRAGPIIGSGSASFEMLRYLTERLPVMLTPRWVLNAVQPIAVRDILSYMVQALDRPPLGIVEVGADRQTFMGMMKVFAQARGYRRWIIPVPVLAPALAARWVGLVTPISNRLAIPLVEGVVHPVVADTTRALAEFPTIHPIPYRRAIELAILKVRDGAAETRWSGALGQGPTYELTDREGLMQEERSILLAAPPEAVFAAFTSLGGEKGWLVWNRAWQARGLLDRMIGGPGLRRGRRHPSELLVGEALDFWRVEAVEPPRLLRLRAEMKVPGHAWLQFEAVPEGDGTRLIQRAIFAPRGVWGPLYWYSLFPLHSLIFSDMIKAVGRHAV